MIRKQYKIIILFFATILTIEIGMRIIGYSLYAIHNFHDVEIDRSSFRILAIGESTTDDFWAGKPPGPWPRQLETMLKAKGQKVQVFNEGHAGYKTQLLLSKIDHWIEQYRPHVVISMMGVNDSGHISYIGEPSGINDFINQIKVVKLIRWTFGALRDVRYKKLVYQSRLSEELKMNFLNQFKRDGLKVTLANIERNYSPCNTAEIMRYIARKIEPHAGYNQMPETMSLIEGALTRCPQQAQNLFWYYAFGTKRRIEERYWCFKNLDIIHQIGTNLDHNILSSMEPCLDKPKLKRELAYLYENKGIAVTEWRKSATDQSYQKLFEKLKSKDIHYIAMQYPTLDIDSLRDRFTGVSFSEKEISFVDNNQNFKDALKERAYNEIFSDRFQGSWGHTTFYGHSLIAKRLVPIVTTLYSQGVK